MNTQFINVIRQVSSFVIFNDLYKKIESYRNRRSKYSSMYSVQYIKEFKNIYNCQSSKTEKIRIKFKIQSFQFLKTYFSLQKMSLTKDKIQKTIRRMGTESYK